MNRNKVEIIWYNNKSFTTAPLCSELDWSESKVQETWSSLRRNPSGGRTCSEGTGDAAHKDGLAGIEGLRSVHHKVAVAQVPRSDLHLESKEELKPICRRERRLERRLERTHGFVLDGGAGDAQVELPVLLHAGFDQSLHWALLLEQQEGVSCETRTHVRLSERHQQPVWAEHGCRRRCPYLWVGSRTCSPLCGASPPPGDRSGGSLRWFRLGEGGREKRQRGEEEGRRRRDADTRDAEPSGLTFVNVGGQTADKHLPGEALDALPVLVGVTVRGAQDALVAVAVVEEIVINGEKGGAA